MPGTFPLSESQRDSTPQVAFSFPAGRVCKTMFSLFVKIFLTKKCFTVNIIHSFVNFTWFTLVNCQKFDDRLLFKPGAVCLIFLHFELSQKKYFYKIKMIFV